MSNKYYKKKVKVSGYTRNDPRCKKPVKVGTYQRDQRYRNYRDLSMSEAKRLFNQRPQRSKTIDKKTTSKKVLEDPNEYWKEHMNRTDVKGIDTKESKRKKPELAFGYGYNPDKLKSGIKQYEYSHTLEDGSKLYEFQPKLPYRIFKQLAKEIGYEVERGNVLKKGDIEIKNSDFITKGDPEEVIKNLNYAIKKMFQKYESVKEYDAPSNWKKEMKKTERLSKKKRKVYDLNNAINRANAGEQVKVELDKEGNLKYRMRYPSATGGYWGKCSFQDVIGQLEGNDMRNLTAKYGSGTIAKQLQRKGYGKKPKHKPKKSILPKLTANKKYFLAYVNDTGSVRYIGHTQNPEKAIRDLDKEREVSKRLGVKSKVELFVADDIHDVRDQIHARGRDDYLITGDTFPNRKKIHQIARMKFDYNTEGYRGKLSKEELDELKKIRGLKIEKYREFTPEEQQISREIRAEKKSNRYSNQAKRLRASGTARMEEAKKMRDVIPMGQPILVGHHSEKRHRNYLDRMNKKDSKGYEELKKAEKLERKAKNVKYYGKRKKGDAERRRQANREAMIPKLKEAKRRGKKVNYFGNWYDIKRVNQKTITVNSKNMGDFRIDISLLDSIES